MGAGSVRGAWRLAAAAALVLALTSGCGFVVHTQPQAAAPVDADQASDEPTTESTPDEPPPTTKPPVKPSKKAKPKATKVTPTKDPNWDQAPDCATYPGKKVSRTKIKSALQAAAKKQYWRTEAPSLRVTYPLVKAIAWQESGWQQNIRNCDGGLGVMQAMPDTVDHMNQRFGLAYDPSDYRDNADLGANYLAWMTKYYGDAYFKGNYSLSTGKCKSHSSMCLLNMVIAGYNAGYGSVEDLYKSKKLPNPGYVDSVRSLMNDCYCDRY
jgi:soluble lytic murein transglycosylase-like protein